MKGEDLRGRANQRRSKGRLPTAVVCALFLLFQGVGCVAQSEDPVNSDFQPSIEILALSRGRGVPKETREALERMKSVIARMEREGSVITSEETVFGLEGETRLCVVFKDQAAASTAQSELRKVGEAVDLLQIRDVVCKPR